MEFYRGLLSGYYSGMKVEDKIEKLAAQGKTEEEILSALQMEKDELLRLIRETWQTDFQGLIRQIRFRKLCRLWSSTGREIE